MDSDEKVRKNLEKEIIEKIKEMRMGKKVMNDEVLVSVEEGVEEDVAVVKE
ncbi:hypothetical protein GW864_03705 [bacterium]|nr:hypothetical protein [bacterium]